VNIKFPIVRIAFIIGVVVTGLMVIYTYNSALDHQHHQFHADVNLISNDWVQRISTANEVLRGMRTVYITAKHIDADDFQLLSIDALNRLPFLRSTQYTPKVNSIDLLEFLTNARDEGYISFNIHDYKNSILSKVQNRMFYLPIVYQEPFTPISASQLGLDILSNNQWNLALHKSIDHAEAITSPFYTDNSNNIFYSIFTPIYAGKRIPKNIESRRKYLTGVISVKIDVKSLIENLPISNNFQLSMRVNPDTPIESDGNQTDLMYQHVSGTSRAVFTELETIKTYRSNEINFQLTIRKNILWNEIQIHYIVIVLLIGLALTYYLVYLARKLQNRDIQLHYKNVQYQNVVKELEGINIGLKTANDKANTASACKNLFFANMSHELRTPLNAIIGYSELIMETFSKKDHDAFGVDIERILSSGKHLLALVNEILELSKIESEHIELKPEQFDLQLVICKIIEEFKPMLIKNTNELYLHVSGATIPVYLDKFRIKQVVVNLIANACKFTNSGRIDVLITLNVINNTSMIDLHIVDTGIGIEEKNMSKLFQRFSQADQSISKEYGGSGIGLIYSQKLCELMGGTIEIESKFGIGTDAHITIPNLSKCA